MAVKPFLIVASLALASICVDRAALAQGTEQPTQCEKVSLATPWLAWGNAGISATSTQEISIGQPYALELRPANKGPAFEGAFRFNVKAGGTFRFALESAAWIDVVEGASTLKPKSFGHGPTCSGIRKIVDFDLAPGTYSIRVTKSAKPKIKLLAISG